MRFSLISPTFKRPDEVTEFLESLLKQDYSSFEVILGDGTPGDELRPLLREYENNEVYPLKIVYEEFLPVSDARNRAAQVSNAEYLIFLDSDCIIPPDFLKKLDAHLERNPLDAFGGPDAAHKDFSVLQKAISYSMTSFFTTGGIRGRKKSLSTFHPRGFNMGMKRSVFEALGGFSEFRCGEDIEFSIRIRKAGYKVGFIPEAYVYHKRRTSLKQFFKQVFRFGAARINVWKRHREEMKPTHLFPFVFMLYSAVAALGFILSFGHSALINLAFGLVLVYLLLILVDSWRQNTSFKVAMMSVLTTLVMLYAYGWGFFRNWWAYLQSGQRKGLEL